MALRLEPSEAISDGLRRCAREQLDGAIERLTVEIEDDFVEAVHGARKSLKKERSLLRLGRGTLKTGERRRENAVFRSAGQGLSDVRDADVMIETLDKLAAHYGNDAPRATLMTLRAHLQEERAGTRGEEQRSAGTEEIVSELQAARDRIDDWTMRRDGWSAVEQGLQRTYRDGRIARRRAKSKPTTENLHEWRKRCKDLWYQLRLLAPISARVMHGHIDDAHQLSDLLGDAHDLAVLRERLVGISNDGAANIDALNVLIEHRRRELQVEALATGARMYAEPPKQFTRRMRSYWKSWRAELTTTAPPLPRPAAPATAEAAPHGDNGTARGAKDPSVTG